MFEQGRVYRRDSLHREWGGSTRLQQQGRILTPREVPLIVVVTGEAGGQYGYFDYWDDEGVFHYFGAGQDGDMEFVRGNLALRDHVENGEDVHLFEQEPSGLRYFGQVVQVGYDEEEDAPDRTGELRKAIVFKLVPLNDFDHVPAPAVFEEDERTGDERWTMPLDELRGRASRSVGKQPNSQLAKRTTYSRSEDLRIYVKRRAAGACEGCSLPAPFITSDGRPYLEPHHTRRLSDGGPDDYHHVIALCATCHRRVHHGMDGSSYNDDLIARLAKIEP